VQHNLQGSGIRRNDDQLSDAPVQSFGGLIGTFLDLLEHCALSHQIVDLRGELFSGKGLRAF
jgi:hypothetical protein